MTNTEQLPMLDLMVCKTLAVFLISIYYAMLVI